MVENKIARTWEDLTDQEQIYMWWNYNAANPDDPVSFPDF